jgi:hypothetical protein
MKRKSVSAASELETLRSVKRQKTGGGTGAGPGAAGPGAAGAGPGASAGVGAVPGAFGGGGGGAAGGLVAGGGANNALAPPHLVPEIVLLDGPTGKMPMLAGGRRPPPVPTRYLSAV